VQHSILITEEILHSKAGLVDSRGLLPELLLKLISASIKQPTELRIPFGGSVGQTGWDGIVVSPHSFLPYVPEGQSFWEVSTSDDPEDEASKNFSKRTAQTDEQIRKSSAFVFVTPRSASYGPRWDQGKQQTWIEEHLKLANWHDIRIIDGTKLVQWLYHFPGVEFWLAKELGIPTRGLSTPLLHWELLRGYGAPPGLRESVFLIGRETAVQELLRVFRGETSELLLETRYPEEGVDFVAAALSSLDEAQREAFAGRCLLIDDADTWKEMCNLQDTHVFVATPSLDVLSTGASLRQEARNKRHGVIFAGIQIGGIHGNSVRLAEAKDYELERVLASCGYTSERARTISSKCGGRIPILKRLLLDISASPDWAAGGMASELAIAALIGQWDGNLKGDREAIEGILGKPYGEWLGEIRPMTLRPDPPLIQRDEKWRFVSRFEGWQSLGVFLSNEDLDRFLNQALRILREKDPKFTLPPEDRWKAQIQGKKPGCSDTLREGFAETLALLGVHPKALASCSVGKPDAVAALAVRGILKDADWVLWASLNDVLPLLAEASPEEFLKAIEEIVNNPENMTFHELFAQEGKGPFWGQNYMTGILWALETLAWHQDYLTRVTVILGHLEEIDPGGMWANRPANSLTRIFLPWLPHTCTPIAARKVAVEALLRECPEVAWKLLLALLPHSLRVTMGNRKPSWREFIPLDHSDRASREERNEQVATYANLIVQAATIDLKKLSELIDQFDDLPAQTHSAIFNHLSSETVLGFPEREKAVLWEGLVNLIIKHRKFADQAWAMPKEQVDRIEAIAEKLKPSSPALIHRRLFCQHDYALLEEKNNFEEQWSQIEERRTKAMQEILDLSGIECALDFAHSVTESYHVGMALGNATNDEHDLVILPKYLVSNEKQVEKVTAGYVWSRFAKNGWKWVDGIKMEGWTNEQKAAFLALLPFGREAWARAKTLLGNNEILFWKRTDARPYALKEELPQAVENLLQHGRARAAIECLNWMIHEKIPLSIDLVSRVLIEYLKSKEPTNPSDQHECGQLIKWLQNNPETNNNTLSTIEWYYLPLLDYHLGLAPKTLGRRLAEDPKFFCEVIRLIYRSRKEEKPPEPTEEHSRLATNAYHLLDVWRTPPGTKGDGSLDGEALKNWLKEVKTSCEASGHLRGALDQIGKVFVHSPSDPSGLWIHKSVAEVLNDKDHDIMRDAFQIEILNQRGVFTWTAGRDERALAEKYRQKAAVVDKEGYFRLAATLRKLAASYDLEADREASQDPFDR
jgi:hypothetical protein